MRTCPGAPFCSSSRGQPCLTGAITPAQSGSLAPGSATRPYPPPPMWPSLAPPPVVHVVATSGPYRSTGEPLSLMCWLDTSAYGGVRGPLSPCPECSQSQSTPNPSARRHGVAPASAPPALALTSTDPSLPAPASQTRKSEGNWGRSMGGATSDCVGRWQ
ncbi:unnamed protein product [Caretta caretta]